MYRGRCMQGVYLFLIHGVALCADVEVSAAKHARMKLCVCPISNGKQLEDVAERIRTDLAFSEQFEVMVQKHAVVPSKEKMKQIGAPLALFIIDAGKALNWWLYDTLGPTMIKAQRSAKRGASWRWWAHNLADAVWPVLTGKESSFSSKIAYCKDTKQSKAVRRTTCLCVADFDGTNERSVVDLPTVNVAPRWNRDSANPLLFYSEYTRGNVRLMAVDHDGGRRKISNFDGINMLPAFSCNGEKVVYCASRDDTTCQLYLCQNNKLEKLTHNSGTNISPALDSDGSMLFYCSDADLQSPQIYCMNLVDRTCKRLTNGGSHGSLSFSTRRGLLAYTKRVDGIVQVFTYNPKTNNHTQLTFDQTNKHECSWSPCGNRLIFAVMRGNSGRLACLDLATKRQHYLTNQSVSACYSSCSALLTEGFEPTTVVA